MGTADKTIPPGIVAAIGLAHQSMRELDLQMASQVSTPDSAAPKQRTTNDFLLELEERNQTLADWARSNGFSINMVYAVVAGRTVGRWGEGRRIVLAMGLAVPHMLPAIAARKRRLSQSRGAA